MPEKAAERISSIDRDLKPIFNLENIFDESKHIDANKNGFVSSREIRRAISAQERSSDDAVSLAVLNQHEHELKRLHDDAANDRKGLSRDDIKALASLGRLEGMRRVADAEAIFRSLDRDCNGRLSREELRAAAFSIRSGATREIVKEILSDFELIGAGAKEISAKQIKEYVAKHLSPQDRKLLTELLNTANLARQKIEHTDKRIYASSKDRLAAVDGRAVQQGQVGDCWLLAALSAVAEKDPSALANMVQQNTDGSYKVTFPLKRNGKPIGVYVSAPTKAELATYGGSGEKGQWGAMIEKAAAELFKQHPEIKKTLTGISAPENPASTYDTLWSAKKPGGLELLTGQPATKVSLCSYSDSELDKILRLNVPMTAGSDGHWPRHKDERVKQSASANMLVGLTFNESEQKQEQGKSPGIEARPGNDIALADIHPINHFEAQSPSSSQRNGDDDDEENQPTESGHEFAVLAYNPEKHIVTIRNPWGKGELIDNQGKALDGKDDGIMQLSLADFRKYFNDLSLPQKALGRSRK